MIIGKMSVLSQNKVAMCPDGIEGHIVTRKKSSESEFKRQKQPQKHCMSVKPRTFNYYRFFMKKKNSRYTRTKVDLSRITLHDSQAKKNISKVFFHDSVLFFNRDQAFFFT